MQNSKKPGIKGRPRALHLLNRSAQWKSPSKQAIAEPHDTSSTDSPVKMHQKTMLTGTQFRETLPLIMDGVDANSSAISKDYSVRNVIQEECSHIPNTSNS